LDTIRKENQMTTIEVKRMKKIKSLQAKIKSRMETPSMDIAFLVIALAIKQWTARN
jgi:hypothetical protein